jgi:hypothetical protein
MPARDPLKYQRLISDLRVWKTTATKAYPNMKQNEDGIGGRLGSLRRVVNTVGRDVFDKTEPGVVSTISEIVGTDTWLNTEYKLAIPHSITKDIDLMVSLFTRWKATCPSRRRLPLPGECATLTTGEVFEHKTQSSIPIGQWLFDTCNKTDRYTKYLETMHRIADALDVPKTQFRERVCITHSKIYPMPDSTMEQLEVVRLWKRQTRAPTGEYPMYRETVLDQAGVEYGIGYWLHAMIRNKKDDIVWKKEATDIVLMHVQTILDIPSGSETPWWAAYPTFNTRTPGVYRTGPVAT